MKRRRSVAGVVAVGLAVAVVTGVVTASARPTGRQARWAIQDLGTLGGKASNAFAINERGQIVGVSDTNVRDKNGHPIEHAFLWQNGKMTDLGSFAGASSASDINDRGRIVGWAETSARDEVTGDSISDAFLWQNGEMRDLTPRRGGSGEAINKAGQVLVSNTVGYGNSAVDLYYLWRNGKLIFLGEGVTGCSINDRGQIVGSRGDRESFQASLWQNGRLTPLGTLPGRGYSDACAINNRGQIVGSAESSIEGINLRAFLWQKGKMVDLGTLGGKESDASDINDDGQIVGYGTVKTGKLHAALWQNGKTTDLGALPGKQSTAVAINERGQIIGCSGDGGKYVLGYGYSCDDGTAGTAVAWQNGKLTSLGTLGGPTEAVAINDHGQIIGYSTTKTGQQHAVLWTLKPGS